MNLILLHALLVLTHSQAQGSVLDWLPANTQTVVMVDNFPQAVELYQSAEHQESGSSFQERFAMEPDEVADLIVGEFLRAELIETDGTINEVAIAEVGAGIDDAIEKIHERLEQHGAQVTVELFGAHEGRVITRKGEDGTGNISVHLIHEGRMLLADSAAAANAIITHLDASDRSGLAQQRGFAEVWKQFSPQLVGDSLAIAWYADPWLKVRSRQHEAEKREASRQEYLFAERHGMTGIVGLGGSVVFGESGAETVQALAYAPKALASSLQMATHLTGTNDLTLPVWISEAVAEVVVLHGNVDKALEHSGLLFDDGFADGLEGTYDEVLLDLKDLLDLDIKKELYPLLGPRLYLLHGAVENRQWQPLLAAFEVQNAERASQILRILIADDPEATEVVLAEESDRVWHVPGKHGGRDFVLGMLKGVAVYANDLEFAKAAMRFDESAALLPADQLVASRYRAVEGVNARPSILIVRKPSSEDQTFSVHPLDLIFQGARFFTAHEGQAVKSMQWLPRRLTLLLARHGVVVGFDEKDGWRFVAGTAGQTEEHQDAP